LRRVIRALAMRTASVLGDGFFGCVSAPPVGCMRNCVGAVEPCWAGCTLIGPVRVGLFPGITDNAHHSSSFDGFGETASSTRAGWTKIHPPSKLPAWIAGVRR
jgi:hypothetical protein